MNWYQIYKSSATYDPNKVQFMFDADASTIPVEDSIEIRSLVEKIVKGNRKWTPKEIEIYTIYPDIIEKMLSNKQREN